MCRSSYINPGVLSSFERGRVLEEYFATVEDLVHHHRGLHAAERALVALLETAEAPLRPRAAAKRPVTWPRRVRPGGDLPLPAA